MTTSKSEQKKLLSQITAINNLDKTSMTTINEYTSAYNFYKKLPTILFWVIVGCGCLAGIILGIVLDDFIAFIVPVIISFVNGALTLFLTKVFISERILNLEYTKRTCYAVRIKCLEDKIKILEEQENSTNK